MILKKAVSVVGGLKFKRILNKFNIFGSGGIEYDIIMIFQI